MNINERAQYLMDTAHFEADTVFGRCLIAAVKLETGDILTASYVCENEKDFDPAIGAQICMQEIFEQILVMLSAKETTLTKAQAKAILAMAESNQVITAAANELKMPRAALTAQLRKIKEQTGKDPQSFTGMCQLLVEARSVLKEADGE